MASFFDPGAQDTGTADASRQKRRMPRRSTRAAKRAKQVAHDNVMEKDPGPPRAIPLIAFDGQRYTFSDEAEAALSALPAPMGVIAVAGKYRTGKSLLMNRAILGRTDGAGFGVGPTVQPCTKGLWMYTEPVECTSPDGSTFPAVVVDTEGIGALDADSTHDTRIFSLALLLSSYFMYNSVGAIDEGALNNLGLVVNVSKHVRVKADEGADATADDAELAKHFPSFMWLVRDFSLQLEDEHGKSIVEDEYLDNALRESGEPEAQKNAVRKLLKTYFRKRRCMTLVRPCDTEEDLRKLDTLDVSDMRPKFAEQLARLRGTIFSSVPHKRVFGHAVSGKHFAKLCRAYVDAINGGAAPVIHDSWRMITAHECRAAADDAERNFEAAALPPTPSPPAALAKALHLAKKSAMEAFDAAAIGDGDDGVRAALDARIDRSADAKLAENMRQLERKVGALLRDAKAEAHAATAYAGVRKAFSSAKKAFAATFGADESATGAWTTATADTAWEWSAEFYRAQEAAAAHQREMLERATSELGTVKQRVEQLTRGLERAASEKNTAESALAAAKEGLKKERADAEALRAEIEAARAAAEAAVSEAQAAAEERVEAMRAQLGDKSDELVKHRADMQRQIEQLEIDAGDLRRQLEAASADAAMWKERCEAAEGDAQATERLRLSLDDEKATSGHLRAEIERLRELMRDTEAQYARDAEDVRNEALATVDAIKQSHVAQCASMDAHLKRTMGEYDEKLMAAAADAKKAAAARLEDRRRSDALEARVAEEKKKLVDAEARWRDEIREAHRDAERKAKALRDEHRDELGAAKESASAAADARLEERVAFAEKLAQCEARAEHAERALEQVEKQQVGDMKSKLREVEDKARAAATDLERAKGEVRWLRENKGELEKRLRDTQDRANTLEARCSAVQREREVDIAKVKMAYERQISQLGAGGGP